MYRNLCVSKVDQGAETPDALLRKLERLWLPESRFDPNTEECVEGFFDPCPHNNNFDKWDALEAELWGEYNYVNPPYDQTALFFKKAITQAEEHGHVSIFLVPCRFHTRFFASALPHIRHISLITKRVRFKGYNRPLGFALCVIVFGPVEKVAALPGMSDDLGTLKFLSCPNRKEATPSGIYEKYMKPVTGSIRSHVLTGGSLSAPLAYLVNNYSRLSWDTEYSYLIPSRLENKVFRDAFLLSRLNKTRKCNNNKEENTENESVGQSHRPAPDLEFFFINPTLSSPPNAKSGDNTTRVGSGRYINGSVMIFANIDTDICEAIQRIQGADRITKVQYSILENY
jgi:hypothetical protein